MPRTTREPTGDFPKAEQVHHLDLRADAERLISGLAGRRRNSENLARESGVSVVMMAMEAGDTLSAHSAPGVVSIHVLRGRAIISSGDRTFDLTEGEMLLFQPAIVHDLRAVEQTVILLTVTGGDD